MSTESRIPKTIKLHLEDVDRYLEKMVEDDFSHKGIHEYRESVRRLRALIFFYQPYIKTSDYLNLDALTKRHFNNTSLIREIDVFEESYGHIMKGTTREKLEEVKKPLKAELKRQSEMMRSVRFGEIELRYLEHVEAEAYERSRQSELLEAFIIKTTEQQENIEKYIHFKRMLAKKIRYVNCILFEDDDTVAKINELLDAFQSVAKALHDVCVNLRFIGQYELEDTELFSKLVADHAEYLRESDYLFERVREYGESYLL